MTTKKYFIREKCKNLCIPQIEYVEPCMYCNGIGFTKGGDVTEYITNLLSEVEKEVKELENTPCKHKNMEECNNYSCNISKINILIKNIILKDLIVEEK